MAFSITNYRFRTESIFEGLSLNEYKIIKENSTKIELKKNKSLFKEGTYPKGIYVLKKGKIKISKLNKNGEEQLAYIYKKGDVFGYRPLLCDEVHPVTATALEDCSLMFISKKHFLEALHNSISLANNLLTTLSHEFTVWINILNVLTEEPVKERIAIILLILNETYKKDDESIACINISRENMASYAGTTIETIARVLRKLKEMKIIKTEGRKIFILKKNELEKIVEFEI